MQIIGNKSMYTQRSIYTVTGVPQGGILSPLLYIIYVSDLDEWLLMSDGKIQKKNWLTQTQMILTGKRRAEHPFAA